MPGRPASASPQPVVEAFAAHVDVPAERVVGKDERGAVIPDQEDTSFCATGVYCER